MFALVILYIGLVIVRPQDYPQFVDSGVPVLPITLLGAALLWAAAGRKQFEAPQFALVFAFLLMLMVSVAFNGWMGGALEELSKFGPVALGFVLVANAITTRARAETMMRTIVLCSLVLAVHGIDQAAKGIGWTGTGLSQGTRIQYVGIFNDPNDLGMLFVSALPMALYLTRAGGWRRLFWLAATGTLLYGIVLTDSRGAVLGTLVMMGVHIWRTRGIAVAGALGAMALVALMALPSRINELDASEASAAGRVDAWYEGFQMFQSSPLWGIGANTFSDVHHLTAHNSFVLVLAETGIIGFTIFLGFVIYCFRMMLTAARQVAPAVAAATPGPVSATLPASLPVRTRPIAPARKASAPSVDADLAHDRALAHTLLIALAGFFTCAFFLSRSYVFPTYLLTGLVTGCYLEMRRRRPTLPLFSLGRDALLLPATGVLGVLILFVVVKVLLATS